MRWIKVMGLSLVALVPVRSALAQTQLTGINIFGATATGNIVSYYWTSDYTVTAHNWEYIWESATPGGAFQFGPNNDDLGLNLNPGTNTFYFVDAGDPPGSYPFSYFGVNLFFNNAFAPSISFFLPVGGGAVSPIGVGTTTPSLLYFPNTVASGVTEFQDGGTTWNLTAFSEATGPDRVNAEFVTPDGIPDPVFTLQLTAVTPEPAAFSLFAIGLVSVAGVGIRRKRF